MKLAASVLFALTLLVPPVTARAAGTGGRWEAHAPLTLSRQEVGAARIGGTVFVVGGLRPGFAATATVEAYDIALDTWSFAAPLPNTLHHAGVAAHGGKLYAIGGYEQGFASFQAAVWMYDPALDTWTARAPLPIATGAPWAVTLGERIFVFGGETAGGTANTTFIYDPALNVWSTGAPLPTPREHLNAAAHGGFLYVIGGRDGAASNANERYDPVADTWTQMAPLPTARSAAAVATFDDRIFVMGGEIPRLFDLNEVYDPTTNTWSCQAAMPFARHGIAAVTLDDRILTPGGGLIQGLQPTTFVDSFVPEPQSAEALCFCGGGGACGNVDAGAGCANSTGQGARLDVSGRASIGADNLVLHGSGLPGGAITLYIQGTQSVGGGAGSSFGDGLLCAGGIVRRLAPRVSFGGVSRFPEAGNQPISVLGNVTPGAVRVYQAFYRNPAGPCGFGFNLTGGVTLTWGP